MAMAQDTIRIGVQLELSGRMAVTGNDTLYGMEVALGLQPEVLGLPVELSVCDNASTVEGAVAPTVSWMRSCSGAGPYSSSHHPRRRRAAGGWHIMVATGAANPAVTQAGDYIFRVPYTDEFEGTVAAQYAYNDQGAQRCHLQAAG